MNEEVAIVGTGRLAFIVEESLSERYKVLRQPDCASGLPSSVKLAVALFDDWRPSEGVRAETEMRRTGVPWLRGLIMGREGLIGPLVHPGKPGCTQCAERRLWAAGHARESYAELQMNLLLNEEKPREPLISKFGFAQTGGLIAAEVRRFMSGAPARTDGGILLVDSVTLESSYHSFLPDPCCPFCGNRPDDTPDAARIALRPCLKENPDIYRGKPLTELGNRLVEDYLDDRAGLLTEATADLRSPFANIYVKMPAPWGDETAAGRTHVYSDSVKTAILEGLERYCGASPRGKRTVVRDSYRNLADRALHPGETGLYSPEQYALPDFPYRPFDPDLPVDWVWGFSFKQDRPILVPEGLAYYSYGSDNGFVLEGSNGCALGGSLEEAVFYGLMEVVERDAFLLAWHAKLPAPRLDPDSSGDRETQLMIDRIRMVSGYEVFLFNVTTENGIPSLWAIAKNKENALPNLICAAGAHLDPVLAAKSALQEIAGHIAFLEGTLNEYGDECRRLLEDPFQVKQMHDHALLYGLPEAESRLRFLLDRDRPLRTFAEEFRPRAKHADLTEELRELIRRFLGLNLDVVVVDQTAPEIARNGLRCAKVLIPGMLPMYFGHPLARLTGLERALRVPAELGYARRPLKVHELNVHPHPFL